jgi:hypothetical protein
MILFLLRRLTTRMGFTILTGIFVLAGCRTTSNRSSSLQSSETASPPDDIENVTDFFDTTDEEFNFLRVSSEAEFLGCLCVTLETDKTKWMAWQFLSVGNKGYRTATDNKTYDDLETCVATRETLMECEG